MLLLLLQVAAQARVKNHLSRNETNVLEVTNCNSAIIINNRIGLIRWNDMRLLVEESEMVPQSVGPIRDLSPAFR